MPISPSTGLQQQIRDSDADTIVHTETLPDEDRVKMTTAGTLRYTIQNNAPQHEMVGSVRVAGSLQAGGNALLPQLEAARIATRDDGSPDGVVGVLADVGALSSIGAGAIAGVAGRALARQAPTVSVFGLDYLAGMSARSLAEASAARVQLLLLVGVGQTVVAAHGLQVRTPTNIGTTITTTYGVRVMSQADGDNRRPYQDESPASTSDNHGNRFLSNTQFASLVGAFGGGAGVIGIANRVTAPATNPGGGGVLYAEGGALKWRGSAGTVTIIAPA